MNLLAAILADPNIDPAFKRQFDPAAAPAPHLVRFTPEWWERQDDIAADELADQRADERRERDARGD